MKLGKTHQALILAVSLIAGVGTAASQVSDPDEQKGLKVYEAFEGSSNGDGQVMTLTSSATYNFNQHFAAGLGIPIDFDRSSSSAPGTSSNTGIGDAFLTLRGAWRNPALNYGTSITGSVPMGDSKKGLSTGHATFNWDNRFDREFTRFTPFVDLGIANSLPAMGFYNAPFTSFGTLAHFEAGTHVDLLHSFSLTLSAYDIAPWGTQTIISRFVDQGSKGGGGRHGRVYEVNHQTTGSASLTRDNGYTVGLSISPKPYLDLGIGYTRSVHFALNTVWFGVGLNVSSLLTRSPSSPVR